MDKTKRFTRLQLLNITDGRLITKIEDVYDILNHVFGRTHLTHEIPDSISKLYSICPEWLSFEVKCIEIIKLDLKNDFNLVTEYIKNHCNVIINVPQITD